MILVKVTINGTLHRVAKEVAQLDHLWKALVVSISPIVYAPKSDAGGYVSPVFGNIKFASSLFVDDFYPPKSCAIELLLTDTTEAAAQTIFSGTALRVGVDRDGINYNLYGEGYTVALSDDVLIDGDLDSVFTTYCGASYLNLTFNNDYARATSPSVYRKFEAGTLVIDMLSVLAEDNNHQFYDRSGTLYLVDMLLDNGTTITATEFDFKPVSYQDQPPHISFDSQGRKLYSVAGSYGVGEPLPSGAAQSIEHIYGRLGDNSGNDMSRLAHTTMIPYETGKYYKVVAKARQSSGSGTFYAGLAGMLSDRTTFCNSLGNNAITSQHTICLNNESLTSSWLEAAGYASGWAATGDTTVHNSVASPAVMQTNVAYVRPLITANYLNAAGECDIDYFAIYEVDSSGNVLAELFYDDFTDGWSENWINYNASGGEDHEISTSVAESTTNIETALGNLKTIMEMPRAAVTFKEISVDTIPNHGQRISWEDASVTPDVDTVNPLTVSGWIRARTITLDIDADLMTVEGEGSFT